MQKPTVWNFDDIDGKVFGRLEVIGYAGSFKRKAMWRCRCECGIERIVYGYSLRSGETESCGCLHREKVTKHGACGTPTYSSWLSMRVRCSDPNAVGYKNYGERGIRVCERWADSFDNFLADMGERPPAHTLDRIDSDGNYEPNNCRWASYREQSNNTRRNVKHDIDGRTMTTIEWARESGLPYEVVRGRLRAGMRIEDALRAPIKKQPLIEHDGRSMTIEAWAIDTGISASTISGRILRGWSVTEALTIPPSFIARTRRAPGQGAGETASPVVTAEKGPVVVPAVPGKLKV